MIQGKIYKTTIGGKVVFGTFVVSLGEGEGYLLRQDTGMQDKIKVADLEDLEADDWEVMQSQNKMLLESRVERTLLPTIKDTELDIAKVESRGAVTDSYALEHLKKLLEKYQEIHKAFTEQSYESFYTEVHEKLALHKRGQTYCRSKNDGKGFDDHWLGQVAYGKVSRMLGLK